ncbi:hypothetical protein D1872_206080 [compost metagenome]
MLLEWFGNTADVEHKIGNRYFGSGCAQQADHYTFSTCRNCECIRYNSTTCYITDNRSLVLHIYMYSTRCSTRLSGNRVSLTRN